MPLPRGRALAPLVLLAGAALALGVAPGPDSAAAHTPWKPLGFFAPSADRATQIGLGAAFLVALGGIAAALRAMARVQAADQGTPAMQEIARAVRDGANAYLGRQFRVVVPLVLLLTVALGAAKWPWADPGNEQLRAVALGRALAFALGAAFSGLVGFFGMRLATAGNLRVAAAARRGFGDALRLAYRTGTVTGLFTAGLGLLGGTAILILFGESAGEVLLGFGFGGSLLALFMRVGGGIYTKAADVGADLVGKVEAGMPEDDPRNAATIADNVGDNVGDCAGMAADVFESYAVTMVAAVILGHATLGPAGMVFPLLVMAVGVVASIISTAMVGGGVTDGTAATAMGAINRGYLRSALLSGVGLLAVGAAYLKFDRYDMTVAAVTHGMYEMFAPAGVREGQPGDAAKLHQARDEYLANLGTAHRRGDLTLPFTAEELQKYTPLREGLYLTPAFCALVGIALAVALGRCTEYWTGADGAPVRGVVKSCETGHATNIISGLALGYESSVWQALLIAAGIAGPVLLCQHANSLLFVAYGVAMTGVGMLTLTGDTLSMDVFGPVADNANGIGEMGYNKRPNNGGDLTEGDADYLAPEANAKARQILTDLDAVGNTTKAITKGVAIGSAVVAAVSLFASFIAVLVTGSEEKIGELTAAQFAAGSARLTVADPFVFIGMLLGGAVPLLFSAMTIRAVGRAAQLIVVECRGQFRDPEILAGTKRPDYRRVVDICTAAAQRELVGPGVLAIGAPVAVGFVLGPFALGGFLAGMIVVGQLLAVFMANAGGAWDNCKKVVEDEPRTETTGKGSEKHKASVTGDTVGDPLKDTAGPAINPLIKVMNMVGLLALPFALRFNLSDGPERGAVGIAAALVAALAVAWAWRRSSAQG